MYHDMVIYQYIVASLMYYHCCHTYTQICMYVYTYIICMTLTFVAMSEKHSTFATYVLINQQGINYHYLFHYLEYDIVNLKVY